MMDLRYTFNLLGDLEKELVPGGEDKVVTLENRHEFCQLAREAMMSQFDSQIELIRNGLDDYNIPTVAYMLWTTQELQEQVKTSICLHADALGSVVKVAGSLEISVEALKDAISLHGPKAQKEFFWNVMERLSMEQRGLLLKFSSGRSRLPNHITVTLGDFLLVTQYLDSHQRVFRQWPWEVWKGCHLQF